MVANFLAPPDKIYTMRTDIWCLGALFYEMANLTKAVSQEFTSTYRGVVKYVCKALALEYLGIVM